MVPQRESRAEYEIVCEGMEETVDTASDTSFSSVDTVLREETVSNNRSSPLFSGECERSELQSWRMLKISSSARIAKALKKHERCDFRYYSRLGFARKMCAEFDEWSGGFSNIYLDDDDVFYLLEVTSVPFFQENRDLCIRAVEMRVADNYSINEAMLGYKIIFCDTFADLMKSTLKPNDLILMWGGRLTFVNNERVIAANMARNSPTTVIIWSNDKSPTLASGSSLELSLPQNAHSAVGNNSIAQVVLPDHHIPEDGDENQLHHPSKISGNIEDQNHRSSSENACQPQPHPANSEDESLHPRQSRTDPETRNEVYFERRENIARDFVGTQEIPVEDTQSQKQNGETISKSSDSEDTNIKQDHHSKQKELTNSGPASPLLTTNSSQAQIKPAIVTPMLFLTTQELTIEDCESQNPENNGSGRHSKMSDSVSEEIGANQDQQNKDTNCANAVPASPILFSDSDSENNHTPKKPKIVTVVNSAYFLATQDVSNEGSQSLSETADHSKLVNSSPSPDANKLDQNKKGSDDYELPIQPVFDDRIVNEESVNNQSVVTVNNESINNQSGVTVNDESVNNQSAITVNDESVNNQSAITVNDESIDNPCEVTHIMSDLLDQL